MSFKPNPGQERALDLLAGPQRHTLLVGGSRSGKTFLLVRSIVVRALRGTASRHAILRFRGNSARSSIALDTLPKVMRMCFPEVRLIEHRQDGFFELPNTSQIWIGGLGENDQVEKILGQEYVTLFFNECADIPHSSVLVARTRLAQQVEGLKQRAYYDLNPGGSSHWTNREFIEHRDPRSGASLTDPENYRSERINPEDNAANLSAEYVQSLRNLPEKQRKRFYEGKYVAEVEGALWTFELIEGCRLSEGETLPEFGQIVVGVDPSGATGKEDRRSDEIGIVVVGLTHDGIGIVLEDCSVRDGPHVWGRIAVSAFHRWKADRIVAEINFGGAMVEFVLKTADQDVPVRVINASRGKHVRAEPVSALYENGKIKHAGRFPDLEDQLTNFASYGYVGERSPDRADAMVWAITDLMIDAESSYDTTGAWIGSPAEIRSVFIRHGLQSRL